MKKINIKDVVAVEMACEVLRDGGVVMHPTETCYGFAVDIFNEEALKKLYRLKGRDGEKPVSILVNSLEMALEYGEFSEKALELAKKYWPGPLSIVVPRGSRLPVFLNSGEEFISIRFSSDKFCSELVRVFGGPVTTTSANVSGKPPLYEVDLSQFGALSKKIDLVVDGGIISNRDLSTVAKVIGDEIEVLRHGAVQLS